MASVTLRGLAKRFGPDGRPALDGVSLDVHDGELFVLLGPSGSGKTTLLRCIAGLEEPGAGEVLIGERDVTRLSPAERDVAMVFQTQALYPHLSVRDNIAFGLEVRRIAASDVTRRVQAAAERLGITALLDRRPAELSGGERQRVALGRAIVREPQAFLFDEPLANLDSTLRGELRAQLLELHHALRATMLYVTHDQGEAMGLGQRMAVLDGGRIRQLGTPAELYERPADIFVASFLGSPGMNVLKGRGRATRGGGGVVDCGAWSITVALERYEGEIHLGVRPEHVSLVAPDQGVGVAQVRVVEPQGADTLVRLDAGGQRLVAYVVPGTQPPPTVSGLRKAVANALPDSMVPSVFVIQDELPLTPTGKVDRLALPAPSRTRPDLDAKFVAPRTRVEATLCAIWGEVLGLDQVGIHDHFLELGGNSLAASRVITRILESIGVDLPLRTLFEVPTVVDMAAVIEQRLECSPEREERGRILAALEQLSEEEAQRLLARGMQQGGGESHE